MWLVDAVGGYVNAAKALLFAAQLNWSILQDFFSLLYPRNVLAKVEFPNYATCVMGVADFQYKSGVEILLLQDFLTHQKGRS